MNSNNEDPRPLVEGVEDVVSAVISAFFEPSEQSPEQPAIAESNESVLERFLDRVPEDLRDKVTIQVGSTKVLRPGQDANLSPEKEAILKTALDDPTKVKGSIKVLGEDNKPILQIAGGKVALDDIGFGGPKQTQAVEQPVEVIAPIPTPQTEQVNLSLTTPQEAEKLTEIIARLESRVAALEQQIAQKPVRLNNSVVGGWLNAQRDKLAATVRQNVDKVAVKGHEIADKIAATKQTVVDVADAYKQAAVTAADDLKQSFSDGKAAIVDGAQLVKEVATQGAKDFIDKGMSRHYEAMDGLAAKVNDAAGNIAIESKQAIDDPREAFMEKVLQPVGERMFKGAEQLGKTELDSNGNQSVAVGPYRYSKEPEGIVMRKDGQVVTAATLTKADIASVDEMRTAFPKVDMQPKIDVPKPTQKHKVSI